MQANMFFLFTPIFETKSKLRLKQPKKTWFLSPKARNFLNFWQKRKKGYFGGQKGK